MNPKKMFFSFNILTISLVFIQIPSYFCQDPYEKCRQPFECGDIKNIRYPFWGGDRPVSCGYPGFELTCQEDEPLLNISSMLYRVLEIDDRTQTLKVARQDLFTNYCPATIQNTALDFDLFRFSSTSNDGNITLFYGCTIPPGSPLLNFNKFFCDDGGTNRLGLYTTQEVARGLGGTGSGICNSNITVPVNRAMYDAISIPVTTTSTLEAALKSGFSIEWSANNPNCTRCVESSGVCGYDQDSASFACHCTDGHYAFTCNGTRIGDGLRKRRSTVKKIVIGMLLSIICIVVLSLIINFFLKKRRYRHGLNQEFNQNVENFLLKHGSLAPKRYSYSKIKKITKSFNEKLGQGGYGSVYKGMLPNGSLIAVKLLTETNSNGEEFIDEVSSISRTSHVNIVNLLGFCYEGNKRALIYEFMPNKSLDKFITHCRLDWDTLYKIAVGVARGLDYLHGGCNTRIVHFDIKPQNILLDEDFCPKISDFGLAKLCKKKQSIISVIGTRGTVGYIAPEVFSRSFGRVSHKSDVYSYGMMVLEMAGAKNLVGIGSIKSSENYFPDQIYEHIIPSETRNVDDFVCEVEEEIRNKMFLVGFWCIQTIPSDRPSMSEVVDMLKGNLKSIPIPPKPTLFSPRLLEQEYSSSESVSVESTNSIEG